MTNAVLSITDVVPAGTRGTASGGGGGSPQSTAAYKPSWKFEDTQRHIAIFLLWIFAGVIAAPVLATIVFSGWCWLHVDTCTAASQALDLLSRNASQYVTAIIGIVGSVVGFYFGSNRDGGSAAPTTGAAPGTTTTTTTT